MGAGEPSRKQLIEEVERLRRRLAEEELDPDTPSFSDDGFRDPYRSIVKSIQLGIWAVDPRGRTIYLNSKMARMLGYRVRDMIGRSMIDFLHAQQRGSTDNVVQVLGEAGSAHQDVHFQRSDGTDLWALIYASALTDRMGQPLGVLNLVGDISERKHTEEELRARDDLFRQLGDAIRDVVWITSWPTNKVEYVSPAYSTLWGRSRSELYGNPLVWIDAVHPEDRQRVRDAFLYHIEEGTYDIEYRLLGADGALRWIRDRGFPVRDALGRVYRVAGIAEDITTRKKLESLRAAQAGVLEQLATGKALETVLDALVRMTEQQAEGMLGSILRLEPGTGLLRVAAAPSLPDEYNRAVDGLPIGPQAGSCGTAAFRRERVIVRDIAEDPLWQDYRHLALKHGLRASWSEPLFSSRGEVLGTFAMYYRRPQSPSVVDMELIAAGAHLAGIAIERHRDLETLEANARDLRQIIDLVPHMIFAKDSRGRLLLANRAMAEAYGATVEQVVGVPHADLHARPEEVARMLSDDAEVMRSGNSKFIPEELFTDFKGQTRILQTTKIPYMRSRSREPAVLGVAIDITERKELERQISSYTQNLEQFFLEARSDRTLDPDEQGMLFDSVPDFYLLLDGDCRIWAANRALTDVLGLGRKEIVGRALTELLSPDSRVACDKAFAVLWERGSVEGFECDVALPDGARVETSGYARRHTRGGRAESVRLVLRNLTRRRSMQRRLAQAEQFVTTGRLAASVAHEVNNPLQALVMHLSIVGESLPAEFPERDSWNRIQEGVSRIQQVVNDLLDLHRVGRSRLERVDLNALVEEALRLSKTHLQKAGIDKEIRLAAELPAVLGVSQHLYQVILNLILNAVDAMGPSGLLGVRTGLRDNQVILEIEDTGPGIDPEDLPNIFEPLFTGRRSHGTGLGLFVSYNLIKEHHGDIEVESQKGTGTLMRVVLPRARPETPPPAEAEAHSD